MVGSEVGSYRIVRQIGSGGMGAVYLGEHTLLGKRAAIKVLLRELSDDGDIVDRFFNEARTCSSLHHPGIVDVYDFGRLPDGCAYIVMEFLDGQALSGLIQRQAPLQPELVCELARQVANALAVAHDRGIIHRDLKPDNIFLVEDPDMRWGLRVKVLDFGIAKLTAPGTTGRTRAGTLLGTPAYMSPEQCRGDSLIDQRTDVYALGCIVFEMATGKRPFNGPVGDLIAAQLFDPPPSLSGKFPPPFDALVARMLAKSPNDRPKGMHEVAAELGQENTQRRGKLARVPIRNAATEAPTMMQASAEPPTRQQPSSSVPAPVWVTAAVAGVAVLLGAGTFRWWQGRGANAATRPSPAAMAADAMPFKPAAPVADAPAVPTAMAPTTPPSGPRQVTVVIESQPSGADLYRVVDDVRVGKTPWTLQHAASSGEAVFKVRLKGYRPAEMAVKLDLDGTSSVVLARIGSHGKAETPVAAASAPAAAAAAPPPPAPAREPGSKSSGDIRRDWNELK